MTQEIEIKDVFDFFEIYSTIQRLIFDNGIPIWINVTSGPSVAIAAMALISVEQCIPLVAYDKEMDRIVTVRTEEFAGYYHIKKRYGETLNKLLEKDEWTLKDLADEVNRSTSSVSRQVTQLRKAKLVAKFTLTSRARGLLYRPRKD